jgi:conjugative transposon TraM protein
MESVTISKKKKKRKFLLVLPILVIPFMTMAFWALGGGKGNAAAITTQKNNQGLNLQLPSANIKEDKDASKMSFYEKAKLDEEKSLEAMKNDPYYKLTATDLDSNSLEEVVESSPTKYKPDENYSGLNSSPIHPEGYSDPNEIKIMSKLSLLQREINKPQKQAVEMDDKEYNHSAGDEKVNGDMDRLEEMMSVMKEKKVDDPEMQKLEGMLDKIMDIQHPERVKEKIKEKSFRENSKAFTVTGKSASDTIVNGFFSIDRAQPSQNSNAIEAAVNENQILVNGAVIKLRLISDMYINNSKIPAGNFVFGVVSLNGERMEIEISSIRSNNSIYPVKMEVYDLDGLPGIYIPGAITRDVAKQSADNSLQLMELSSMDPSLKAQAAAAGVNTVKNLLSRKVKQVKVMVKPDYKVLLKNKSVDQ